MKREILFRGARVCDGHFVNGSFVEVNGECDSNESVPHIVISYVPDTFDWFEVEPETVGQYTGIDDREGEKIFEGDTFFFRLVRADTHMLHKSVGHYSKSASTSILEIFTLARMITRP